MHTCITVFSPRHVMSERVKPFERGSLAILTLALRGKHIKTKQSNNNTYRQKTNTKKHAHKNNTITLALRATQRVGG